MGECAARSPAGTANIDIVVRFWSAEMDRALIIRKPHIDNILDNMKIWEMRSSHTNVKGWIGLIEAGSGLIAGKAFLHGSLEPIKPWQAADPVYRDYHQIADDELHLLEKWRFPWLLSQAERFEKPIPYDHPKGAVIWVRI